MRFVGLVLLSVLLVVAAPSTDISGEWVAETMLGSSGSEMPIPTTFHFQVAGEKLSGAVASSRGKFEIVDGTVKDNAIRFHIIVVAGGVKSKLNYDGRLEGEGIDFLTKFEGGDRSDQFVAKRRAP